MEIIGLMSEPSLAAAREQCVLILPGTHSKHIYVRQESVIDFRTVMTGELFDVLGRNSLLRASVDLAAAESTSLREIIDPPFGKEFCGRKNAGWPEACSACARGLSWITGRSRTTQHSSTDC